MEDLFQREQYVLEESLDCLARAKEQGNCKPEEYEALVKEYDRLLKQVKRITKMSNKTASTLSNSFQDLWGKVHFDELTGIYNRRFLDENLYRIVKLLEPSNEMLSLLMIDVDYFKKYNDTYGHGSGDTCLHAVAQAIRRCIRKADDFAARYGGEEFLIVLPHTKERDAIQVAEQVLEQVRALKIPHEKNEACRWVTVSVGIASGRVRSAEEISSYVERADEAMYCSKQNGRNQYTSVSFQEEILGIDRRSS